jgi:hypothetical protein
MWARGGCWTHATGRVRREGEGGGARGRTRDGRGRRLRRRIQTERPGGRNRESAEGLVPISRPLEGPGPGPRPGAGSRRTGPRDPRDGGVCVWWWARTGTRPAGHRRVRETQGERMYTDTERVHVRLCVWRREQQAGRQEDRKTGREKDREGGGRGRERGKEKAEEGRKRKRHADTAALDIPRPCPSRR